MKIEKDWYGIEEVASQWNCRPTDIIELAAQQKLFICIDWQLLSEKHRTSFITEDFVFYENDDFHFTPPHKSHAQIMQEVHICSGVRMTVSPIHNIKIHRDISDDGLIPTFCVVDIPSSPLEARLFSLRHDLLFGFDLESNTINIPISDDPTSLEVIGYLSSYKVALYNFGFITTSSDKGITITTKNMFITKDEKAKYENELQKVVSCEISSNNKDNIETSGPNKDSFEKDNIPSNMYWAYSLFSEVWANLPKNMNNPTKKDLIVHLEKKGLKEATTIKSIIKVSTPDGITLGGKPKSDKQPWDITKY